MIEDVAPVWEHIAELRRALLRSLIVIAFGMICAFCFYQQIFSFLTDPLKNSANSSLEFQEIKHERIYNSGPHEQIYISSIRPTLLSPGAREIEPSKYLIPPYGFIEIDKIISSYQLVMLGPLDGMRATLMIIFWIGLVGTSPIWLFFILQFLMPAFNQQEKSMVLPFLLLSLIFLTMGFLFAFFITIPMANTYLQAFNSSIGINLWSLFSYIDYSIALMLANGLAFELCVILLFLVHYGFFSAETLIKKRRHMVILAFILGAILTPPDILTQIMLALPLICLYELAIIYAKARNYKKKGYRVQ
jgi:sec-independent protein translocase protein TatC